MLLIVGFLLGSAATPAFADYGYNRVTSGSFILRGMFTNGGKLLSSGSFNPSDLFFNLADRPGICIY